MGAIAPPHNKLAMSTYEHTREKDYSRIPEGLFRTYDPATCAVFKGTNQEYGEFSNMASGFPLRGAGRVFPSPEALYQSCRFPHLPVVQEKICSAKSAMQAKMVSKPHRPFTRSDWMEVRVSMMRWVIRVKLKQHPRTFGIPLIESGEKPIVEENAKDPFWGSKREASGSLVGCNVLGRLLMELRMELRGGEGFEDISAAPPAVADMLFFEKSW